MEIFFDVDTQNDFMNKDGALYVPDAESLKPNLKKLTQYALENDIKILGSIDKHFGTEEYKGREGELQKYGGPFPDHCMKLTPGINKIPETSVIDSTFIENKLKGSYDDSELKTIVNSHTAVFFEKQSYDVATNPNFERVIKMLGVKKAYVSGVAEDYCVSAAVLAMRKMGIEVVLIMDAMKGVDIPKGKLGEERQKMAKVGVGHMITEEVLK